MPATAWGHALDLMGGGIEGRRLDGEQVAVAPVGQALVQVAVGIDEQPAADARRQGVAHRRPDRPGRLVQRLLGGLAGGLQGFLSVRVVVGVVGPRRGGVGGLGLDEAVGQGFQVRVGMGRHR